MADLTNVTIRCNDCRQDLVTLWRTQAESENAVKDLIFWRHAALQSHRSATPECVASGATVQTGWPVSGPPGA
jgi:hypothetical protein